MTIAEKFSGFDVEIWRDVRIPTLMPDVTLSADVYRPSTSEAVPALVTLVPYRKDAWAGLTYQTPLRWFAERGYACVVVDLRGTGSSDGAIRPPFDPGEADDAVAAIDWAAAQPWCNGDVGMWGFSYAATATLRAASRAPAALKAIVPIMGTIDPERDWVHPEGVRGGLASLGSWATHNLKLQLLPPLSGYGDPEEQHRWRQRLLDMEHVAPFIVDMLRHGPGHPVWRERTVDATNIKIPTLCIGGWRDVFCAPTIRTFEQVQGPKRLIMGPWTHTLPSRSPTEAINFCELARRWWDRWLRGIDNGADKDPDVVTFVQGDRPGWNVLDSWPPPTRTLSMTARGDGQLCTGTPCGPPLDASYRSDPTTGVLSGLWFTGLAGHGAPLDQHDDDVRSTCFTSAPLSDSVVVAGRAEVTIRIRASGSSDVAAQAEDQRVVVRLAAVDSAGRSTYITGGLVGRMSFTGSQSIVLSPTAYRIPAGNRIRVVLSQADFPRLWPKRVSDLRIEEVRLHLPVSVGAYPPNSDETTPPGLQRVRVAPAPSTGWEEPRWTIARDPLANAIEVVIGRNAVTRTPCGEHVLESRQESRAGVRHDSPDLATFHVTDEVALRMAHGVRIEVAVTTRLGHTGLHTQGQVRVDGTTVFSRTWTACLEPVAGRRRPDPNQPAGQG